MVINCQDNTSSTLERVALKTAKDYYYDDENGDTARETASLCSKLQQIVQLPVLKLISYTSVGHDWSGLGTRESGCDSRHRTEDLIELHTKIMSLLLQKVLAQRARTGDITTGLVDLNERFTFQRKDSGALNELSEMIEISSYDDDDDDGSISSGSSEAGFEIAPALTVAVSTQIRLFITQIASMYKNKNAFHNFEHASHVTFGAYELVRRLAAGANVNATIDCGMEGCSLSPWRNLPLELSESTNGLASDALAQFAVVFSALLHDVEHDGVPNTQLAKEKPDIAKRYQNKSLAEQNSVDIGWELLGEDCFRDLRACIFPTENDRLRFRKMYVNVVMATDICEPSLRSFHEKKIEKAFSVSDLEGYEERNRRATVAMDLFIQVSDISHTMQSFSVYRTWNERLYQEMYSAYLEGRAESDPSESWYKGELGFYDFHIIPLLTKIKETGVLGSAASVLLQNAKNNRLEWEKAGKEKCTAMQERVQERLRVEEAHSTTSKFSLCCWSKTLLVGDIRSRTNGEINSGETDAEGHKASGRLSCLRLVLRAKTS